MFYINTKKKIEQPKIKIILDTLMISPELRQESDHRVIYNFLIQNQFLKELQRTKSLNARIKCIASILLINKNQYSKDLHVKMYYFDEEMLVVVLLKQKIQQYINYDQTEIRKRMADLERFSILNSIKYNEFLFLASHMQYQQFLYKNYVYKENEPIDFIYLVLEGEFHYLKDAQFQKYSENNKNRKNKKSNIARLKSLQKEEEENPNRIMKKKPIQYKIGIIEGNTGQSFGLEQYVASFQKPKQEEEEIIIRREYSVQCQSVSNKAIKIEKTYFQVLFHELPSFYKIVKHQILDKKDLKNQIISKIKKTKQNLRKFISKTSENLKSKNQSEIEERGVEIKDDALSRYMMPKILKKSTIVLQNKKRAYSMILNARQSIDDIKSLKNSIEIGNQNAESEEQENHQNQYPSSFILTDLSPKNRSKKTITKTRCLSTEENILEQKNTIELPIIKHQKSDIIESNKLTKSWTINTKAGKLLNNYGGLIDSSILVREKQYIMSRKITRLTRESLFPKDHIRYKVPLIKNQNQLKLLHQKVSPAHSKKFMEKMLVSVLKKAGYDEAVPQYLKQIQKEKIDKYNKLSISSMKIQEHLKKREKVMKNENLLVSSAFDDCFFSKMQ